MSFFCQLAYPCTASLKRSLSLSLSFVTTKEKNRKKEKKRRVPLSFVKISQVIHLDIEPHSCIG
jgi:hypothetical protein